MTIDRAFPALAILAALTACTIGSANAQFITRSGSKLSSESVTAFGFESELADDFVLPSATNVTGIVVTGGPYASTGPGAWNFRINLYSDTNCTPDFLLATFDDPNVTGTSSGTDTDGFPIYSYSLPVNFPVIANTTYWFSVQAWDHAYPPQWGVKLTTANLCPAQFRSAYFGYPGWTDESLVPEEHSIDAQIVHGEPVAVNPSTWGRIKGLYR